MADKAFFFNDPCLQDILFTSIVNAGPLSGGDTEVFFLRVALCIPGPFSVLQKLQGSRALCLASNPVARFLRLVLTQWARHPQLFFMPFGCLLQAVDIGVFSILPMKHLIVTSLSDERS